MHISGQFLHFGFKHQWFLIVIKSKSFNQLELSSSAPKYILYFQFHSLIEDFSSAKLKLLLTIFCIVVSRDWNGDHWTGFSKYISLHWFISQYMVMLLKLPAACLQLINPSQTLQKWPTTAEQSCWGDSR